MDILLCQSCPQFSIINILLCKGYFEAQAGYLLGKAVTFGVDIIILGCGNSLIYQLLPLMFFAKRALKERPTEDFCVNE
jgi:hypothetical protein